MLSFPRNHYRMAAIGCQHLEPETASTIIDTRQVNVDSGWGVRAVMDETKRPGVLSLTSKMGVGWKEDRLGSDRFDRKKKRFVGRR